MIPSESLLREMRRALVCVGEPCSLQLDYLCGQLRRPGHLVVEVLVLNPEASPRSPLRFVTNSQVVEKGALH